MTFSLVLNIAGTVATLWLLGSKAITVALDIHDGEDVRQWAPQAGALLVFLVVLLSAIWF